MNKRGKNVELFVLYNHNDSLLEN